LPTSVTMNHPSIPKTSLDVTSANHGILAVWRTVEKKRRREGSCRTGWNTRYGLIEIEVWADSDRSFAGRMFWLCPLATSFGDDAP
jgi:hypothetical protein